MFDVSNLISTLLGGLLTIAGGITGSYLIQTLSDKNQKRKEIRNIAEALYKDSQAMLFLFIRIERESAGGTKAVYDIDKISSIMKEFEERTMHMQVLIHLYFHPLQEEYTIYNSGMSAFAEELVANKMNKQTFSTMKAIKLTTRFQESVISLMKKEGYKYF